MQLIFFGHHTDEWERAFLDIDRLDKRHNITSITIIRTANDIADIKLLASSSYIIPIVDDSMIELYEKNIEAIMPRIKTIEMFRCKKKFYYFAKKNNLLDHVPKTFTKYSKFLERGTDRSTLYIVKPNISYFGEGMRITNNVEKKDFHKCIVQQYIEGNIEYCAHVVANKGKIKWQSIYRSTFQNNIHILNRETSRIITRHVFDPYEEKKIISVLELFLLKARYTGVCCFDFLIVGDNVLVLEINPRFGGSITYPKHRDDLRCCVNALLKIRYQQLHEVA